MHGTKKQAGWQNCRERGGEREGGRSVYNCRVAGRKEDWEALGREREREIERERERDGEGWGGWG